MQTDTDWFQFPGVPGKKHERMVKVAADEIELLRSQNEQLKRDNDHLRIAVDARAAAEANLKAVGVACFSSVREQGDALMQAREDLVVAERDLAAALATPRRSR